MTIQFLTLSSPSFEELLEIVTLQSLKELHERSSHSQAALTVTLGYLANGNAFEDMKFINALPQTIGIIVLETCLLLGRQTVTQ
jgi:hypothetical protein